MENTVTTSKFVEYSDPILLVSSMYINILDKETERVWTVSWNHQEHVLLVSEITHTPALLIAQKTTISFQGEKYLVLNPYEDGYEVLLNLSFSNHNRNLEVELLKRPYLTGLDLQVKSNNGESTRVYSALDIDEYPIFIDHTPAIHDAHS